MPRRSIDYHTPGRLNVIDFDTGEVVVAPSLPVICANFRHYRIASGLEQKELAKRIGVNRNAVSSWETGRTRPDINLIPAICRELEITPYELLGMQDPNQPQSPREKALLESYRRLDERYRTHVDQVVVSAVQLYEREYIPQLFPIPLKAFRLAAGPSVNYFDITDIETVFLHDSPYRHRADALYIVNGDSMEPDFHNGDRVFVEHLSDGAGLRFGEIGAFCVGNETYIKQYREDGLYSLNPDYAPMLFDGESASVYLIGRVLGIAGPELDATPEEIRLYLSASSTQRGREERSQL